jgi:hypothetical protein
MNIQEQIDEILGFFKEDCTYNQKYYETKNKIKNIIFHR